MRKSLLAVIVLCIGVGGSWLLIKNKTQQTPEVRAEKSWPVSTQIARPTRLAPTITLYAHVESPQLAKLSSAVNAEVIKVFVQEGNIVASGELLIQLDGQDNVLIKQQREADVLDNQAQIQKEKNNYHSHLESLKHEKKLLNLRDKAVKRLVKLRQQKATSTSSLDIAQQTLAQQQLSMGQRQLQIKNHVSNLKILKAKLQRSQALLQQAKIALQRTQIRAPFRGRISKRHVTLGDRVTLGAPLINLYNLDALEVRAQIPESYIAQISAGLEQQQDLQAEAILGNIKIQLILNRLAGKINLKSGGVDALFHIKAGSEYLRLGQFLPLTLKLNPVDNVIAIPYEAIYGQNYIYLYESQRMQRIEIENLGEQAGLALVKGAALKNGVKVITTQLPNAMDGLKIINLNDDATTH